MIPMIFIFISLSLGTLSAITAGSVAYNVEFIEPVILIIFTFLLVKVGKVDLSIKISKMKIMVLLSSLLIFIYSLLTFVWTSYGLSVLSGAIPLLYISVTLFISLYFLEENTDIYVLGSRIFILCLFIQLLFNIMDGVQSGATGFYAVKAYASTLIGKSNFISFFFVFDLIYEFISKEKHWLIFLFIDLLAVVFTVSRGAIVSLVLSLVVFFIIALFNRNFNAKNLIISFMSLGAAFLLFILLTPSGRELFEGLTLGLKASTVSSRQILWNDAFYEIAHSPLGIGVVWRNNPHNFMLDALRNLGLFFGSAYILMIVSPLFCFLNPKIFNSSKRMIAVLVAYLSVVIHSFIEVFFFTKISIIWTFITLTFIFFTIKQEDATKLSYSELAKKSYIFNNSLFEKLKKNTKGV